MSRRFDTALTALANALRRPGAYTDGALTVVVDDLAAADSLAALLDTGRLPSGLPVRVAFAPELTEAVRVTIAVTAGAR